MALTKTTTNDKIEVLALAAGYPVVQVRTTTIIAEDGVEISRIFHHHYSAILKAVEEGTLTIQEAKA